MPRPRKRQRGVKGRPWYRKFNDTWYVDWNDKQTPIRDGEGQKVKGADSRDLAERCWVIMQAQMMAPQRGEENPLRLVFGRYLDHVRLHHPDAYPAYKRTLVGFADSLPEREFLVKDLTAFHIDDWLKKYPDWSDTTKATYIAVIMAALNWASEPHRRLIPNNPVRGYRKPRRRSRGAEALVPPEAHEAFLDHVPQDFKVILSVLRDTGTRPGNICRVTAAHCNWEDGGWWFAEENAVEGKVHKTFAKTGEGLFVPLSGEVLELCRQLAQKYPEGPLFRTAEGAPWNSDKIAERFRYYRTKLAKAGVPMPENYFAYCYRHTRLTELLEDGESDAVVAAIAGHKGTTMLHAHYSHILAKRGRLTEALRKHLKGRDRTRLVSPEPGADSSDVGGAEQERQGRQGKA